MLVVRAKWGHPDSNSEEWNCEEERVSARIVRGVREGRETSGEPEMCRMSGFE